MSEARSKDNMLREEIAALAGLAGDGKRGPVVLLAWCVYDAETEKMYSSVATNSHDVSGRFQMAEHLQDVLEKMVEYTEEGDTHGGTF